MNCIAVLVCVIALVACAESTASVDAQDPWEAKSADPEFVRRAEDAITAAEPTEARWQVGVILAEHGDGWDWEASVLTRQGPLLVESCSSGANDGFGLITDPGDLVSWSLSGGDNRVCLDEFTVIRKAAA